MIAQLCHVIKQLYCESYSAQNNRERLMREMTIMMKLEICIVQLIGTIATHISYVIDDGIAGNYLIANNRVRGISEQYVTLRNNFPQIIISYGSIS